MEPTREQLTRICLEFTRKRGCNAECDAFKCKNGFCGEVWSEAMKRAKM